jgi:pyruvate kinase
MINVLDPLLALFSHKVQKRMTIQDSQNTKIVATVGPACNSYSKLLELTQAGVDVFRLNFSHGTHEDHLEVINHLHHITEKYNVHVGILADLQGPKIRIGKIGEEPVILEEDDEITFVNEPCIGTKEKVYMSYEQFAQDVSEGERVLLDDGKLVLEVVETNKKDTVRLKTIFGGPLSSNKGVNLPETKTSLPALTEKDLNDLKFILKQDINWIALSFVRSSKDVDQLRKILDEHNHQAKIIAKIEKPEAVKKIDKIIKASNGIMIARGDLGVEVPIEKLPMIQKEIIQKCIQRARPVIVATQMMDSMIQNPSPTRAEVTDVANAVLDGADAVMLSGETSVGRHPVKVVEAMNRIIEEAETQYAIKGKRPKLAHKSGTFLSDVICFNAAKTAEDVRAKAILGLTISGYTGFKISSYRPKSKIYIFSPQKNILGTLNLVWGVRCFYYDKYSSTDETIEDCVEILKEYQKVQIGDVIVNTGSMPIHKKGRTNMLKITEID